MNPLRHYATERDMSPTIAQVTILPNVAALEHRVRQLEAENAELRNRLRVMDPGGETAEPGQW